MKERRKKQTPNEVFCCIVVAVVARSQPISMMKYVLFIQIRFQIKCEWKRVKEKEAKKSIKFSVCFCGNCHTEVYILYFLLIVIVWPMLLVFFFFCVPLFLSACVRAVFLFIVLHTLKPCVCMKFCWHNALAPCIPFGLPACVYHLKFASFAIE